MLGATQVGVAGTFTVGIEFEDFAQNLEKVFAVSRAIEIIGEAVKRISGAFTNAGDREAELVRRSHMDCF